MIEETVTKEDAKQIIADKAKRVYKYAVLGLIIASFAVYKQLNDMNSTYFMVMLFTALVTAGTLWLSLIMQRSLVSGKTYSIDDKTISVADKVGKTIIDRSEITNVRENKSGLIISAGADVLRFPNYLKKYVDFKRTIDNTNANNS